MYCLYRQNPKPFVLNPLENNETTTIKASKVKPRSRSVQALINYQKLFPNDNTLKILNTQRNPLMKLGPIKAKNSDKQHISFSSKESSVNPYSVKFYPAIEQKNNISFRQDDNEVSCMPSLRKVSLNDVYEDLYRQEVDVSSQKKNSMIVSVLVQQACFKLKRNKSFMDERPSVARHNISMSILANNSQRDIENKTSIPLKAETKKINNPNHSKLSNILNEVKPKESIIDTNYLNELSGYKPLPRKRINPYKNSILKFVKEQIHQKMTNSVGPPVSSHQDNVISGGMSKSDIFGERKLSLSGSLSVILPALRKSSHENKKENLLSSSFRSKESDPRPRKKISFNLEDPPDTSNKSKNQDFKAYNVSFGHIESLEEVKSKEASPAGSPIHKRIPTPDIELSKVKIKRKPVKILHPLFDQDEKEADAKEDQEEAKKEEPEVDEDGHIKKGFKNSIFRKRFIKCMRKIKLLKLSTDEVASAGKIFSTIPFEKEYSEQFMKLVKAGNVEEAKYILFKYGKYLVYDFDNLYQTPLHWAARKGLTDMVSLLIDNGSNVDAADMAGRTPLYFALLNNHVPIIKLLLGNHADPWSCEDFNYRDLCVNKIALYYLSKARQLHILLAMTPPKLREAVWKLEGMQLIMDSWNKVTEKRIKDLFGHKISVGM